MTLFKVDDGMWGHPKFDDVSDAAVALWTRAGSWCCRYLTDGVVPASRVIQLRGNEAAADELVRAGLWRRVEGGFCFHDWSDIQETKAEVETRRSKQRDEKRQQRATKPKKKSEMSATDNPKDSGTESRIGEEKGSSSVLGSVLPLRAQPQNDTGPYPDAPVPPLGANPAYHDREPRRPPGSSLQAEVLELFRQGYAAAGAGAMPKLYGQPLLAAVEHCREVSELHRVPLKEAALALCKAAEPGTKGWVHSLGRVDPYVAVRAPSWASNRRLPVSPGTTAQDFAGAPPVADQLAQFGK